MYGSICSVFLYLRIESGHQPLSWTARTQVALDTAKGIEYIHDHTKSRYVHRDIKTSNILLDEGLRAKVIILDYFEEYIVAEVLLQFYFCLSINDELFTLKN